MTVIPPWKQMKLLPGKYSCMFKIEFVWTFLHRCFLEFLKNLNDYDIKRKVQVTSDPRQARIEAHKRKKALEENLKKFEKEQKEDSVDEELERKYWLENIELYEGNNN